MSPARGRRKGRRAARWRKDETIATGCRRWQVEAESGEEGKAERGGKGEAVVGEASEGEVVHDDGGGDQSSRKGNRLSLKSHQQQCRGTARERRAAMSAAVGSNGMSLADASSE